MTEMDVLLHESLQDHNLMAERFPKLERQNIIAAEILSEGRFDEAVGAKNKTFTEVKIYQETL